MLEVKFMCFCLFSKKKNNNSAFTTKTKNIENKNERCNHHKEGCATPEMSKNKYNEKPSHSDYNEGDARPEKTKNITIVMKPVLKCETSSDEIVHCLGSFKGVTLVMHEWPSNVIIVRANLNPFKLKEKLENITKEKVELISVMKGEIEYTYTASGWQQVMCVSGYGYVCSDSKLESIKV